MASVYYRCFSCGEIFYTEADAGMHVSTCSKVTAGQLGESSQAEILDDSEPLPPFLEDQEKPTEEPEDAPETGNKNFDGKTVFMWNRAATLLLINLYEQHEPKFHNGTYKKKQVWHMIAKEVKAAGYRVTILQCENRWKTLMSSYRRTKFLNQLSGNNNNKICNYFAELDALIKGKRTPSAVVVRRRQVEPSTPDKTLKKIRKKECGRDLCEILQKMEERSEQRHQERMALQRDMMNTHKHFMQSILQMLMDEKGT